MKVYISPEERPDCMSIVTGTPPEVAVVEQVDLPDYLVSDLQGAYVALSFIERKIAQYLLQTGQWERAHVPEAWMDEQPTTEHRE